MYARSVRLAGGIYDTIEEFQGMIPGVTPTSRETERLGSDAIRTVSPTILPMAVRRQIVWCLGILVVLVAIWACWERAASACRVIASGAKQSQAQLGTTIEIAASLRSSQ